MPYDHQLARQAAALVRRLPVLDTPQFHEDYLTVRLHCKEEESVVALHG